MTISIPKDPTGFRKRNVDPKPAWGHGPEGVWIRCLCGLPMNLQHEIAADGTVSPSIWHDTPECGWHVHGKLEEWKP